MTRDKTSVALRHVLEYAAEAQALVQGRSRSELETNRMFNLALMRALEVIGEATNRVSPEIRERHPQIPWRRIIDMRNRLIHAYDTIDLNLIWQTVTQDLPPLIEELKKIVPQQD